MIRLFTLNSLAPSLVIQLEEGQGHYLSNVMRLKEGDELSLFNGKDGLWKTRIISAKKSKVQVEVLEQLQQQSALTYSVALAFAPIKNEGTHFIIEKATELGVNILQPIFTDFTQTKRLNFERLSSNIIEASEQSERLSLPELREFCNLRELKDKYLEYIFLVAYERGENKGIFQTLSRLKNFQNILIIIGPEGGFSEEEKKLFRENDRYNSFSLGDQILRAETAALCSLSIIQEYMRNKVS
jgi:16S rRNA (uracil1498-N3)-methyltransferase